MKKKVMFLISLVFLFTMMTAVCGVSGDAATSVKQIASGILINNDKVVADVYIDISDGYSIAFDWNGISLIEGEYTNLSYPLVTIVALADGAYERQLAEYQDSESFKEEDGVITFVDILGEFTYMFMLGGRVPVSISFEKGTDQEKINRIMDGIELVLRQ